MSKEFHYVYRIKNLVANKHYYGCRSSKTDPKLDIGIKYFSSSKDRSFLEDQQDNPQNYKYIVVRQFENRQDAIKFEILLHKKFKVSINEQFYNRAIQTDTKFDTTGISYITEEQRIIKSERWKRDNPNNYRDLSGTNNPMYGSYRTGPLNPFFDCTHSIETKKLVSLANSGKSVYKDEFGNTYSLYTTDIKVLSGEVVSINLGYNQKQVTCPYCNKTGGLNGMNRFHFKNCKNYENKNIK